MKLWQCRSCLLVYHEGFGKCVCCDVPQESGLPMPKLDGEQMRSLAASCLRFDRNPPRSRYTDFRVLEVKSATCESMQLRVVANMIRRTGTSRMFGEYEIHCHNALEWQLINPDPNCLAGGPPLRYYEKHPLIPAPGEQFQPGSDGELFDPPLDLKLLVIDQSYIIAEQFTIHTINEQP